MRFLHVADIHLDSPMRHLRRMDGDAHDVLANCTRRALTNLVDWAVDPSNKIDFVAIAGDVFDGSWKDYQTGLFFQGQMLRLKSAGIPVVAIRGNHDAQGKMTRDLSDWRDSITFLDADKYQTLRGDEIGLDGDLYIHGQSFRDGSVTENLAEKYPTASGGGFHLGLLHTSLTGDFEGHDNYAPCRLEDLRSRNYGYWALGHIHIRHAIEREGDEPPIRFSGNLQGRNIREEGPKGALVVDVDDSGRATCEFRAFDCLRWKHLRVALDRDDDATAALERLEDALRRAMSERDGRELAIRVSFEGRCAAHRQFAVDADRYRADVRALAGDVGQGAVWVEKVRFPTEAAYDRAKLAEGDGPTAELIRLLDEFAGRDEDVPGTDGVDDLLRKLPVELKSRAAREGDESGFLSPEHLRRLMPRAEAILLDMMQRDERSD